MCFLINFLLWWSVHWCDWGVRISYYYCYCQVLLLCLLVFVLCIEVLLCWVHRYLQLLCLPLGLILDHYVVSLLISCNILYFKIYFVWYEDCLYLASLLHGIYFSILSLLVSICLEVWSEFLVDSIYMGHVFVSIQSICDFCWNI